MPTYRELAVGKNSISFKVALHPVAELVEALHHKKAIPHEWEFVSNPKHLNPLNFLNALNILNILNSLNPLSIQ
jgi:hypothetical protein